VKTDAPRRGPRGPRAPRRPAAPPAPPQALDAPLQAVVGALAQPAWALRLPDGALLAINDAALAWLELDGAQAGTLGAAALVQSPEDLAWWAQAAAGDAAPLQSDTLLALPDGRLLPATRSIAPLHLPGTAAGRLWLVTVLDRSAEHRAAAEREALLAQLQATLDSTDDGILVTDARGRVRLWNRRLAELWDCPQGLLNEADAQALLPWMAQQLQAAGADPGAGAGATAPLPGLDDNLAALPPQRLALPGARVLERVSRPLVHGGRVQGQVHAFRDLSERLAAQSQLQALAATDALTGLPNRSAFTEHLQAACDSAGRGGPAFALLLLDVDHFRRVNESLGPQAGDQALRTLAHRMLAALRRDDLLARAGPDQFLARVEAADLPAAESAARRLLRAAAQPLDLDGQPLTLTCSAGVVLCPTQGHDPAELMRDAEAAMRAAKAGGRAGWRVHQRRIAGDRRRTMHIDQALRQAVASARLRLHYQPRIRLANGTLHGAEALLRWRDPELGEVSPGVFIPVAEDSGLINAIGDWVLGQAVRQAALWRQRGHEVPIAINVSALQFQQAHFVERVASVLAVSGLPPQLLELELTESVLLREADEALARLHALATLGVRLAIDDFGTGYSSLAYLKRMPVRTLKIDRSFVSGLPDDAADAGIVRGILQMAGALGMDVVAEGVETEGQRDFLARAGCAACQGFLYAPALDALSFERRLLQRPAAGADGARQAAQPARPRSEPVPRRLQLVPR
jgi:diguanylate cyclase (GGDEF)-like protein